MAKQQIVGFHKDDMEHWVAELACGHAQHVRHEPPWQNRPWVTSEAGRIEKVGQLLNCLKCIRDEPKDGEWP